MNRSTYAPNTYWNAQYNFVIIQYQNHVTEWILNYGTQKRNIFNIKLFQIDKIEVTLKQYITSKWIKITKFINTSWCMNMKL